MDEHRRTVPDHDPARCAIQFSELASVLAAQLPLRPDALDVAPDPVADIDRIMEGIQGLLERTNPKSAAKGGLPWPR